MAKLVFFRKSPLRSSSLHASTHKVHRPKSQSPLHSDTSKKQVSTGRSAPGSYAMNWVLTTHLDQWWSWVSRFAKKERKKERSQWKSCRNPTVGCAFEPWANPWNPTGYVGILYRTDISFVLKRNSMKYILCRTALKRLFGTFGSKKHFCLPMYEITLTQTKLCVREFQSRNFVSLDISHNKIYLKSKNR